MPVSIPKPKTPWEERFRTPTLDALRGQYPRPLMSVFDAAKSRLDDLAGLKSEIAWQGIAWRWSLAYRTDAEPTRPWICLVPRPAKPVLVMPLAHDLLGQIPAKKLSKFVRDGLIAAPEVVGIRWPQWELSAKTQVEDVMMLAQIKHDLTLAGALAIA
jgi:hypothetical protein